MPKFVTFYSFKGGVGRTLALANVAWTLAERGKRVVVVDMDFEAPSLRGIPEFATEIGPEGPGMLDWVSQFAATGELPEIDPYLHRVTAVTGRGGLWVMPAGARSDAYTQSLAALNWGRLHAAHDNTAFVAALRARLRTSVDPDYVLVDSRTGLSDVGGFSTHRLADMLVLVFNLTRPCLHDSVAAYRAIVEARPDLSVFLVASPVPPGDNGPETKIGRRLAYAAEQMPYGLEDGRPVFQVRYDPAMVLADELAVRIPDRLVAAGVYRDLTAAIRDANEDEVFRTAKSVANLRQRGQVDAAVELLRAFTASHPTDADGWLALGRLLLELGRPAAAAFERVTALLPQDPEGYWRLGAALAACDPRDDAARDAYLRARALGERSPEFFSELASLYDARQEPEGVAEAFGAAARTVVPDEPGHTNPPAHAPAQLRTLWDGWFQRRRPYPAFDAEAFWVALMGSLSLSNPEKGKIYRALLEDKLTPVKIRDLERIFAEEAAKFSVVLGAGVGAMRARIAEAGIDVGDAPALEALLDGTPGDAEIAVFLLGTGMPVERRWPLAERAITASPGHPQLVQAAARLVRSEIERGLGGDVARGRLEWLASSLASSAAYAGAWFELAFAFSKLAERAKVATEARGDRARAIEGYRQAFECQPNLHQALHNWAFQLGQLAKFESQPDEVRRLREEAIEKYSRAVELKPDKHESLHNWGYLLGELATLASAPEEAKRLHEEAIEKYARAVAAKPDKHESLYNWGNDLGALADLADSPAEVRRWRMEAAETYRRAIETTRAAVGSMVSLAGTLLHLTHLPDATEAERGAWLAEAEDWMRKAAEAQGVAAETLYNYACVRARRGAPDAVACLRAVLEAGNIQVDHVRDDVDWAPFRDDPVFQALLAEFSPAREPED